MSDGQPREPTCGEVLAKIWLLLDDECDSERRQLMQHHLRECALCWEEFGFDKHLKALVARKCGGERAPDSLRLRLNESIRRLVASQ